MARINLLPWREELRKQYLMDFLGTIGITLAFTLTCLYGVHVYIDGMIDYQNRRNKILGAEIIKLNKKIKEIEEINVKNSQMLSKIETIYKLKNSRTFAVHLFEELAKTLPKGVYLTKFKQSGKALVMDGKSQSNAQVSAYMQAIETSKWLQNPRLNIIQSGAWGSGYANQFIMRAEQK